MKTHVSRLRSPSARADSDTVRPLVFSLVLVSILGGCGEAGFYDKQAKEAALREAAPGPFDGLGDVSVGRARERSECPQAPSEQAGPCLAVDVTSELPITTTSGALDPLHRTVKTSWNLFVWLKKNDQGRWVVTHSTYRPKGVPDELK
jgi:hypothetical protein